MGLTQHRPLIGIQLKKKILRLKEQVTKLFMCCWFTEHCCDPHIETYWSNCPLCLKKILLTYLWLLTKTNKPLLWFFWVCFYFIHKILAYFPLPSFSSPFLHVLKSILFIAYTKLAVTSLDNSEFKHFPSLLKYSVLAAPYFRGPSSLFRGLPNCSPLWTLATS